MNYYVLISKLLELMGDELIQLGKNTLICSFNRGYTEGASSLKIYYYYYY